MAYVRWVLMICILKRFACLDSGRKVLVDRLRTRFESVVPWSYILLFEFEWLVIDNRFWRAVAL